MSKFKVGDTVELISGGPQMTAGSYKTNMHGSETNVLTCTWFDELNVVQHYEFHEDQLRNPLKGYTEV